VDYVQGVIELTLNRNIVNHYIKMGLFTTQNTIYFVKNNMKRNKKFQQEISYYIKNGQTYRTYAKCA